MSAQDLAEEFFTCVGRLGWYDDDALTRIREKSAAQHVAPMQAAVELGLLDCNRLDVVSLLLDRNDALPGYEVLELIGQGGMGSVYRARQKALDRVVAIKTVQLRSIENQKALERFEQEARTLARLQHPNIVTAIDFGRSAGRVFLVMEHVDGVDLQTFLKGRDRLSPQHIWQIIRQAAAGLAHASRQGIVHRDIKPANLLLCRPDDSSQVQAELLKITDFGLARLTAEAASHTRLTLDGTAVGTPPYMAPEQLDGRDVDFRADVYGLGATAYQLFAGQAPFAGCSLTQIFSQKFVQGPAPLSDFLPGLDPRSRELVERMMQIEPEKRPSYAELISNIDQLLAQHSRTAVLIGSDATEETLVVSTAAPSLEVTSPGILGPRRRRLLWLLAGLGAMGCAVGLFAAGWWSANEERSVANSAPPARMKLMPVDAPLLLFQGQRLGGWQTISGNWVVREDEALIEGSDGALRHPILRRTGPVDAYQFIAIVDLKNADAAEVQFGIEAGGSQREYVCRLTRDHVEVGERSTARGEYHIREDISPRPISGEKPHAILIERQPAGWFLDFDELPLAALPHRDQAELPEVRLGAEGGPAQFYEIQLTELSVPDQQGTPE